MACQTSAGLVARRWFALWFVYRKPGKPLARKGFKLLSARRWRVSRGIASLAHCSGGSKAQRQLTLSRVHQATSSKGTPSSLG